METQEILDTSVAIERSSGNITIFTALEYPSALSKKFTIIFPDVLDYTQAIQLAQLLKLKGTPVGAVDMMIAAICLNKKWRLLTKDKDFKDIAAVAPELEVKFE